MEVHAHSHTPRKKWTHYFWEFLMLFLAVTLGFFVENQREHYIEHQREKQYAARLHNDLKFDTSIFSRIGRYMNRGLKHYDSISLLFQKQAKFSDDEFVRIARNLLDSYNPTIMSTTYNQMKSSGTLRYIRNTELNALISEYYEAMTPRLELLFEYINEKLHSQIEPFLAKHFDLNVTQFYFDIRYPRNLPLPPNLRYYDRTESSDLLIKNYYKLYYNGVYYIYNYPLKDANKMATDLIENLKKEYHLE